MTVALIVVDVQMDFCPGGALAVPEGDAVIPVLNEYVRRSHALEIPVIASRDWHPAKTAHFREFGGVWPRHCVQDTPGAAFHPDLQLPEDTEIVSKGTGAREDAYSAFQARNQSGVALAELLRHRGISQVLIGGLATDYCVRATVLDALSQGFRAVLLIDASRGVNVSNGDAERAIADMVDAGAQVATLRRLAASVPGWKEQER
ncbi:MAG: bifunctional nicotinamidase/pyrazinamidase [Chloroflexi bacterium]|nr:bifunctional nicotinamidase/pyrazinamidase [Chloroflexota bacterium]